MKYIYNFFCGKSAFFALAFFVIGVVLAFLGKLTPTYVTMASALQLLIAGRSVMDDLHQRGLQKLGVDTTQPKQ